MCTKIRNKILLIFSYFSSLLIFELILGIGNFDNNIQNCKAKNFNVLAILVPFVEAGICHFIFISCITIWIKYNKKISIDNKHLIYWFPVCTFLFTLPMIIPTVIVARFLNIPFGN